ncbi:MAG: hypothetical protein GC201_00295 [Alphaproteobacteria bacterium]|nr:hypothetical protein [Alphaproteobacteria bacterium]
MRRPAAAALLLLLAVMLAWPDGIAAQAANAPTAAMLVETGKKVARIRASSCAGGQERAATAFVWPDPQHVVTARHVVAGCTRISMIFPDGKSYTATPARELHPRDLVLLTLDRPSGLAPLEIGAEVPPVNAKVAAVGYALGAPTADSKMLDVTVANAPPGSKLADMLDDRFRAKLLASGELDLQTLVLRLDGNLLPGLSGAPLVGPDGRVVGVGTGGLQDGLGGIVWAVRASYVAELPNAAAVASIGAMRRASGLSFADQTPQAQVEGVSCGSMTLSRSRLVQLGELSRDSDDVVGLSQLAAVFGLTFPDLSALRFEVWVDPQSGASVAVPEGATLTSQGNYCTASVGPGVDLFVRGVHTDAEDANQRMAAAQQASQQFEQDMATLFPAYMQPDPSFTYPMPKVRAADGFVVRRSAYANMRPASPYGDVYADYAFVTHMMRGGDYVGVGATRRGITVNPQAMQFCQVQPADYQCQQVRQLFAGWARAALAVHLSTMPPI